MFSAVLTVTVMSWGWVPAGTGEIPDIQPPPTSDAPAPETPAPDPPGAVDARQFLGSFANYPPPPPPRVIYVESDTEVRWYGWQLLLADLGSLVLIMDMKGSVGAGVGVGGLVLGAPALHFINHNYGTGVASLAVRGGVALMVASLANGTQRACPMNDSGCGVEHFGDEILAAGVAFGLLLGGVVYMIVDDTALARVTVPRRRAVELSPIVAPQAEGVSLGVGGSF